jgi:hypothetical protein
MSIAFESEEVRLQKPRETSGQNDRGGTGPIRARTLRSSSQGLHTVKP